MKAQKTDFEGIAGSADGPTRCTLARQTRQAKSASLRRVDHRRCCGSPCLGDNRRLICSRSSFSRIRLVAQVPARCGQTTDNNDTDEGLECGSRGCHVDVPFSEEFELYGCSAGNYTAGVEK